MSGLQEWIAAKKAEVALVRPLNKMASDLAIATGKLDQIRRLHRPDEFGSWCLHCGPSQQWPCATFILVDGGRP